MTGDGGLGLKVGRGINGAEGWYDRPIFAFVKKM